MAKLDLPPSGLLNAIWVGRRAHASVRVVEQGEEDEETDGGAHDAPASADWPAERARELRRRPCIVEAGLGHKGALQTLIMDAARGSRSRARRTQLRRRIKQVRAFQPHPRAMPKAVSRRTRVFSPERGGRDVMRADGVGNGAGMACARVRAAARERVAAQVHGREMMRARHTRIVPKAETRARGLLPCKGP